MLFRSNDTATTEIYTLSLHDALPIFDPLPSSVRAAYRLSVNEFKGTQNLQLIIEHWEPA